MEEINLATPSLLFSAVSLIMLAYTNRFLSYAQVIRTLRAEYSRTQNPLAAAQIKNLHERLHLTWAMQILGISSLLLCVVSMFLIYVAWKQVAVYCFGLALLLLAFSLIVSIREIMISVKALELYLDGMSAPKESSEDDE
jgi:hypothetical protein